ncbi:MAG: phosphopantothenoylcysteine decarboxylase [Planctomycetes bacterium]|nr:phosphopantothenoylcysteine decarboxylase [Planctomycetota bacterium]
MSADARRVDGAATGRRVLLGVGGGIAAYKMAFVASRLVQQGHHVRVAMSRHAEAFIGRATFEGLTGRPAIVSPTQVDPDGTVPHIAATRDADVLVIGPATADLLARLAAGVADDAVCLAAVACRCRRIVCPAMNDAMWEDGTVQRNVATLRALGFEVLGPATGWLAEGYAAVGRMVEPDAILAAIEVDA